jgi:hypothetical protein
MITSLRLALPALILCVAGCGRAPDSSVAAPAAAPPDQSPAPPAAPAAGAADAAATAAGYACADGTRLQARFGDHDVVLRWPDGRSLTLPRAESASKGGGDVYVGDSVSLQRDGVAFQLHDGDRAATACSPAGAMPKAAVAQPAVATASGAVRYACDPETTVTRNADGSYRVDLPRSPPIRLTRIAGSNPPVYTGASLYLRIERDGAILSQGDRTNELRCSAG